MKIRTKKDASGACFICMAAYVASCALFFPERTARSVSAALSLSVKAVVPAIAAFVISYGILAPALTRLFFKMKRLRRFFRVSAGGMCMIFSGMFSGFPMGAVVYADLKRSKNITDDEGRALMPYSNNAGAAFLIGGVGAKMFSDAAFGAALFLFQTAAVMAMLVLTRKKRSAPADTGEAKTEKITPALVARAISNGGKTMIGVISFIVFFSVLGDGVVADIPLGDVFGAAVRCFLEISGGMNALAGLGAFGKAAAGFAVGFSGMSVYMQAHFASGGEAMGDFLRGKALLSLLCGAATLFFVTVKKA